VTFQADASHAVAQPEGHIFGFLPLVRARWKFRPHFAQVKLGLRSLASASIYRMTAKEKLRARVEDLTEQEAEATLDFIVSRGQSFDDWLSSRPADNEPLTPEEQAALAESDADIAAGHTVSYEQVKHDLGSQAG
jgi:hypothetical protein